MPVPTQLAAEICRETGAPLLAAKAAACTVVTRLPVTPGPSRAAVPLTPSLTSDPVAPLRYRVRILNAENRSAGDSKAALAASGKAPESVMGLHAAPNRAGAIIEWQTSSSPAVVELVRDRIVPPQPATKPAAKPAKSPGAEFAGEDTTQVRLRSADTKTMPPPADPGGTLDHTAKRGESYTYRAQRVRSVAVNGQTLELRSQLSSPVTLHNNDVFPPAVPTGLASVPSTSNGKAAVDLSWQPGSDLDLAGYNVYRRTPAGSFARLNSAPVTGPAYTDADVTAASSYTYRVTAVDSSGNESAPSSEVTETAGAPTP
jgi:hypothetical protein